MARLSILVTQQKNDMTEGEVRSRWSAKSYKPRLTGRSSCCHTFMQNARARTKLHGRYAIRTSTPCTAPTAVIVAASFCIRGTHEGIFRYLEQLVHVRDPSLPGHVAPAASLSPWAVFQQELVQSHMTSLS
jgi:hypothetical protein